MKYYRSPHKNFDSDGRVTGQLYVDPESKLYLFEYAGKHYISAVVGPKLKALVIDAETGEPNGTEYDLATKYYTKNGKNYWQGTPGYLWRDGSRYVISRKLGWSTEENFVTVYDDAGNQLYDEGYWEGDSWWSSSSLEGTYVPRGSINNSIPASSEKDPPNNPSYKVEFQPIVGYVSDELLGVYRELDEDGKVTSDGKTITIGLPQFKDQNRSTYVRSYEKSDGNYAYGSIHRDATGWLIGVRNSSSGWWEGSEPKVDGSVTFSGKVSAGAPPSDLTISFDQYVDGGLIDTKNRICGVDVWQK